ncbi:30S ribosomal protein S8 [Candidatus Woesearchaeota archaeon]|nr:30S ribosomal protein S8 [Candidatus Woesearchaeota archaeon]
MVNNDPLSACLSKIDNAGKVSKKHVDIATVSKIIKEVLEILKKNEYIDSVDYTEIRNMTSAKIALNGHVNKTGAIKPRFKVNVSDIEKFEQRYLPAKGFGMLIISTSQGLLTNAEAKEKRLGGRLIAYCY